MHINYWNYKNFEDFEILINKEKNKKIINLDYIIDITKPNVTLISNYLVKTLKTIRV